MQVLIQNDKQKLRYLWFAEKYSANISLKQLDQEHQLASMGQKWENKQIN